MKTFYSRSFTLLWVLVYFMSCGKREDSPSSLPRVEYVNQRFAISMHESVQVIDTSSLEINASTGSYEHPSYTVSFDSVLRDTRNFGVDCMSTLYGWVFTKATLSKGNQSTSDTLRYKQCTNLNYGMVPKGEYLALGKDTLYMLRAHPVALDSPYCQREDTSYYLELILKH